jgi:hypothetical protein
MEQKEDGVQIQTESKSDLESSSTQTQTLETKDTGVQVQMSGSPREDLCTRIGKHVLGLLPKNPAESSSPSYKIYVKSVLAEDEEMDQTPAAPPSSPELASLLTNDAILQAFKIAQFSGAASAFLKAQAEDWKPVESMESFSDVQQGQVVMGVSGIRPDAEPTVEFPTSDEEMKKNSSLRNGAETHTWVSGKHSLIYSQVFTSNI